MELRCPQCDAVLIDSDAPCPQCGFDPLEGPQPLVTGDVLEDRYRVDGEIGRGGMGVVYRGTDLGLQRPIAIKTLLAGETEKTLLGRFMREARALASVAHPALVPVYAVGRKGQLFYMIMKYVEGQSLDALLRDGPLPLSRLMPWIRSICGALSVLHAQGLVHRDIKPSNLMIGPDGGVTVMDLGIVKAVGEQTTTLALGTPRYMAPETLMGAAIDGRADQYALAVVLWQALTGEVPFDAQTTVALLYKQVHERPAPLRKKCPELPRALAEAIDRALAKDPEDRFPSIDAFLEAAEGRDASHRRFGAWGVGGTALGLLTLGAVVHWGMNGFDAGALLGDASVPVNEGDASLQGGDGDAALEDVGMDAAMDVTPVAFASQLQALVQQGSHRVKEIQAQLLADQQNREPSKPPANTSTNETRPATVKWKLSSDPSMVQVYYGKRRLGQTPLTVHLPKGSKPVKLTFKRKGYYDHSVTIDVQKDGELPTVQLKSIFELLPPQP